MKFLVCIKNLSWKRFLHFMLQHEEATVSLNFPNRLFFIGLLGDKKYDGQLEVLTTASQVAFSSDDYFLKLQLESQSQPISIGLHEMWSSVDLLLQEAAKRVNLDKMKAGESVVFEIKLKV